jgi:hypothetical protein
MLTVNCEHTAAAQWPQVLYTDETAKKGKIYYYRIKAMNDAGASAYSPILKYAIP